MKKIFCFALVLLLSFGLFAEGMQEESGTGKMPSSISGQAKYVFLFIGDGMAIPQINTAEAFLGTQTGKNMEKMYFSDFSAQGITSTYALNSFITDSAAAGTALATGYKTNNGMIAYLPDGRTPETLAELAQKNGMAVGIVSTTRLTHATPASFSAHHENRNAENDIAMDMSDCGFEYIAGGGYRHFVPAGWERGKSKRSAEEGNPLDNFTNAGYKLFLSEEDTDDFLNWTPSGREKVFGAFTYSHLSYEIDRRNMGLKEPSLAEMTAKGIDVLTKYPNGFFMMVEGGRIDHACHANDAVGAVYDTFAFNEAVQEAIEFYKAHPKETLIVVTADHETGGLTLGFAGTKYDSYFERLMDQTMSYEAYDYSVLGPFKKSYDGSQAQLNQLIAKSEKAFGLDVDDLDDYEMEKIENAFRRSMAGEEESTPDPSINLLYGSYEPLTMELTHVLNNKAGLSWTSYSHTGVPVATMAMGVGEAAFVGYYDNTDIYTRVKAILTGQTLHLQKRVAVAN